MPSKVQARSSSQPMHALSCQQSHPVLLRQGTGDIFLHIDLEHTKL